MFMICSNTGTACLGFGGGVTATTFSVCVFIEEMGEVMSRKQYSIMIPGKGEAFSSATTVFRSVSPTLLDDLSNS